MKQAVFKNQRTHNFRHLGAGGNVIVRWILRKGEEGCEIGFVWLLAQDKFQWQFF
jgi:hypothetical protein